MNIDDLTIGQIKEINCLLNLGNSSASIENKLQHPMIGKKVIIRTYSAGVWFGLLEQKEKNEVILKDARRMYQWFCKESISLSAVAIYGINQDKSRICVAVPSIWLEAIEILPCSDESINSLEAAPIVKQS